jgi:hypothetical protein
MRRQPAPFWWGLLWPTAFLIAIGGACLVMLAGCASTNAVGAATDTEQRAYAVYGTFVVIEERGAALVTNPATPPAVTAAIRVADAKAKPTADALLKATQDYLAVAAQVKAGTTTADKLTLASANLNNWITTATVDVNRLVTAVKANSP